MNQKITSETMRSLGLLPSDGAVNKKSHGSEDYPTLGLKVAFVGSCFLSGAVQMFAKAGCKAAQSITDADLVVFLGGEDVDPQLYGEKRLAGTYINAARDAKEIDAFTECLKQGKTMFGICRGMQFLHVMAGGKLFQDVQRHGTAHDITDVRGTKVYASSMHHQMCIEFDDCVPLAWATEKGRGVSYETASKTLNDPTHLDLEAACYPNINAVAVQGHPEVGGFADYTIWCLNEIERFMEPTYKIGHNRPQLETPL